MKFNKLSLAVSVAMLGVAGQASATAPTVAPAVNVFVSGASAQQLTIGDVVGTLCQAGTIDVFYDTGTAGKDYRSYSCSALGVSGIANGTKIRVENRTKGGSFQGTIPVAKALPIEKMTVDGTCVDTGTNIDINTGTTTVTAHKWNCPNKTTGVPDGGVSDIEPLMFTGINKTLVTDPDFTQADESKLTRASQTGVIFGVAVSGDVYSALAAAQGVAVPSLTRTQVASLLSGNYQNWAQVNPALSSVGVGSAGVVNVCRRTNGSGTQAFSNAFFLGYNCTAGSLSPTTFAGDNNPGTYTVVEGTSAGAVGSCLATAGSVAVLATEKQPTGAETWKYVALNGVQATVANAASGAYEAVAEQSFQRRNQVVNGVAVPTAAQAAILDAIQTRSGDPAVLKTLPGVAALWTNGYTPSIPFDSTNPVLQGTRFGNTCTPITSQF